MTEQFSAFRTQALFGQLLIGLINGSFYAMLSLGLAIIFGLLNIINFAHGAQYMLGAFVRLDAAELLSGIGYWVGAADRAVSSSDCSASRSSGCSCRRSTISTILYGLLLTFGMALVDRGPVPRTLRRVRPALPSPAALRGGIDLGFMFLPVYRPG